MNINDFKKTNVLITGGTSGIGFELARVFAKNKYNIAISSSSSANLIMAKQKLEKEFSTEIKIIEQDLSELGSAKRLYDKLNSEKFDVDILINNAGYGLVGKTEEIDLQKDEKMMILNVISLVELCKLFLPKMYEKGQGKILNVSSIGAFQPGPYSSTYFASKAFVLSYSRAIRYESKKRGVQVCALCPGATETNFFAREGKEIPKIATPADMVAEYAYKQLMKNKAYFISGFIHRVMQIFPTSIKMSFVANIKK